MTIVHEKVIESLGLHLAQTLIDKAFALGRLDVLIEAVKLVLTTTQWVTDDSGVITPVVAPEPLQQLHALVLNSGAPESYAPTQ
jgi:hypothetical protein